MYTHTDRDRLPDTPGSTAPLTSCLPPPLPLLQLDSRAASIHHPLTSDPDPQTCTSSPAFRELRVGVGWGRALGPCDFWKAPSPHSFPAQANRLSPGVAGVGSQEKEE